ncbi:hypothetical protein [Thiocapsa roseopersicina]|uniref:DUF4145 domain-containing protein n=1 Tax=Thiocapsa roseopersicina TaxID=1058 RepID=A0A1H2QTA9_THIRO|nr:hypothetical protein [Thiocapsa roseopersicina]SDW10406.1 hypothetical protein SAMN05421783_101416 [Thiocapsa roseopersicina]
MNNIEKYKDDLDALVMLGHEMELDLTYRHLKEQGELTDEDGKHADKIRESFEKSYQRWYTESCSVIRQLIPFRYDEFEHLYKGEGRRKDINGHTYTIQDWQNGIRSGRTANGKKVFDDFAGATMRFKTQLSILKSIQSRFTSTLFDIRQLVQADLFDSELGAARELLKHKFVRGAGAIAGVVLERHLAQVMQNHSITTRKTNPSISEFNDLLKNAGVLDTPSWRQIQRLGDIRNLCDHNKEREPTMEETEELISGVEKFTKTLF